MIPQPVDNVLNPTIGEDVDRDLVAVSRRCLILVDAGYVRAVVSAHHNAHSFSDLEPAPESIASYLIKMVEKRLACAVLRVHWYDGVDPTGNISNPFASAMNRVPRVRLREGTTVKRDEGWVQKGVDGLIIADMVETALTNHAVSEMVLISGDGDITPGVEVATRHGVTVRLWSIYGEDLPHVVSRSLESVADEHFQMSIQDWARLIPRRRAPRQVSSEVATPTPSIVSSAHRPTPAIMPATKSLPDPEPKDHTLGVYAVTPVLQLTPLYDLNRHRYEEAVEENRLTTAHAESKPHVLQAAEAYVETWWREAPERERESVSVPNESSRDFRPIPSTIDADLLRFAQDMGVNTYGPVWIKKVLRQGFWEKVRELGGY